MGENSYKVFIWLDTKVLPQPSNKLNHWTKGKRKFFNRSYTNDQQAYEITFRMTNQ